MTTNDHQLIAQICEGNTKAYAQLVHQYKDLVFTLAFRMLKNREEAEEVSQDAFLKVYKSIQRFKGDAKLSTWIYKIAYNTCLDRIKKNKKHLADVPINEFTEHKLETIDNALTNMIDAERQNTIKACVNKLPSDDAYILTLFYFEDLSLEEIAETMSASANTLKVKLFRARKKLAVILQRYLEPETISNYGT
ncbi:RNA polymerase sigma factor [Winogradskyella maritima]|uniref:RNA polymerase sigma factor n=1 Tax=Winogradskyella maritima TaxID=1517766 RepID=A0ABV8AKZ2_9FLAO|nr:RNA polymerase sigma factor [Winogradskyella maritima]